MDSALPYAHTSTDQCYRCGYDLHGIVDDQACPECGLLAVRSRRVSDELHETRPRWLRSLAVGTDLIFWSIVLMFGWCFGASWVVSASGPRSGWVYDWPTWLAYGGFVLAACMFSCGMYLLTKCEGYAPADDADRWLRWWLFLNSFVPLAIVVLIHDNPEIWINDLVYGLALEGVGWHTTLIVILATIGIVPMPLLLMFHLRRLARRARSAHLAEHCIIVGAGITISLLIVFGVYELFLNAERLRLGDAWRTTGAASMAMLLLASVGSSLFVLWALYLLSSFANAFKSAARELRYKWRRDDLSRDDHLKQQGFPVQLHTQNQNSQ